MKNKGYVRSMLLLPVAMICAGFLTYSLSFGTGSGVSTDTVIAQPAASASSLEMPRAVEQIAANTSMQNNPAADPPAAPAGAPAPGTVLQPFGANNAVAIQPVQQAVQPQEHGPVALAYEERVQAQEAIERVFYNHRIWPAENPGNKPAFEEGVSRADIEGRVKLALQESAALQEYWNSPITTRQMQDEIVRMVRDSKSPEMLQELFDALNNNPTLIAECLARPALADRLAHEKYSADARLHAESRNQAEALLPGLVPADIKSLGSERFHSVRIEKIKAGEIEGLSTDDPGLVRLSAEDFTKAAAEFPEAGRISAVVEKDDAFVILYTESKTDTLLTGGAVAFPKKTFDTWLSEVAPTLPYMVLAAPGASYGIPQFEQKTIATADAAPALPGRLLQTSIWTGAETLVWGGAQGVLYNINTGARYTPATDGWTGISTGTFCPSPRWGHTAVWTGREMIVWGGYTCAAPCTAMNTGGRYNPMTGTWSATTLEGACPTPSFGHTAIWSGADMVVQGGIPVDGNAVNASGRYNPATNSWASGLYESGPQSSLPATQSDSKTAGACDLGNNVNVYATSGSTGISYATLNAAFTAINGGTHKGVITIEICGNTSESTTQAVLNGSGEGSASYTSVKIYPIIAARTISGTATGGTIKLYGADNVTIDGSLSGTGTDQSLTINNLNTTGTSSAGIWIGDYSASDAATSNTIKNCVIYGYSTTTTYAGIVSGSGATITNAGQIAKTGNTIQNCSIYKCQYGIKVFGYATSPYDSSWTITGNSVGSTTAASKLSQAGIDVRNATGPSVTSNTIFGVTSATASQTTSGLYFGVAINGATVTGNTIKDIKQTNTTGYQANGITLSASTTASAITVANNLIYDVAGYGTTGSWDTLNGFGIYISAGTNYKIYYNSLYLATNQSVAGYPAALMINGVSTANSLDIRNNIFVITETLGTPIAVVINASTPYTVFSNLDYNDEYAPTTGYAASDASYYYALAGWQAATGKEAHSISADPLFTSTTNLKPLAGSPVFGAATPVSVTTDILGVTRNGSTPTMGAYECGPPYIMYALLTNTTSTSNRSFTNVTITANCGLNTTSGTKPRCYYKRSTDTNAWNDNTSGTAGWKYVEANGSTSPFDFTIDYSKLSGGTGVSAGNTVQYFVVAQDLETTPQVGIKSGTFAATPASVALTSAAFPIAGTIYSYNIPATTYSGAVTVGTGGTFTSLTNTGGLFDMINQGVLSGSVTATITTNLTSETGTIALNQWGESGAGGYTLTIQPSGARTISGTNASGLIKLNGADRVTFNGLNSGGNTLTVTNTNTGTTATVFWIASANASDGANNNTIQNCTIYGAGTSTTVTCINAGSGTTMGGFGEAPNNNNSILNNTIYEAQNGIWIYGPLSGYDQNWTISGNTIGSATPAQMMSYRGIGIQDAQNFAINNNTIFGITSANSSGTMAVLVAGNINGGTINSNIIYNIKSTYNGGSTLYYGTNAWGICLNAATTASNVTVANNVIYDVSAYGSSQYVQSQGIGILLNTGGGYNVWYNSVYMGTNQTQTSGVPSCIAVLVTPASSVDLRNNSFYMAETVGTPRVIYSFSPNTVYSHIDYNDYYQGTATYLGIMNNATNCTTIAAWRTASGQDASSKAANPTYTSTSNLIPLAGSPLLAAATPVAVTTDINGATRNASTPSMGAYECTSDPGTPVITAITDVSACAASGITVTYTAGSGATSHNLLKDGTVVVTGYTSGATYAPGDTSSHTYVVRAVNACTTNNSAGVAGTDINNAPGAPTINSITDVSPCAQSGIQVNFTAGSPAGSSYNLLRNGTSVVTGYTSGTTYDPGSTTSYTYTVQAVLGSCTTLSAGSAFADANGAPGAPTINSITDVDACAQSGIRVNFTAGSPAGSSYNLLNEGGTVVTGYTSGTTYDPHNTGSHTYYVQAVLGSCTTLSAGSAFADANGAPGAPTITSITDNDACAQSGIKVYFSPGSPAGSSYNLLRNGTSVVTGYTSGTTYDPGSTTSYTYTVQAVLGSCTTLSTGSAFADANNAPGAPTITSITDVSACAQSGIRVNFTAGSPAGSSYNLLRNGTNVVTGYTSGTTYDPGSTTSYTYTVQAVLGTCTTLSTGSVFADANNTPGAPSITSITDNDACAQSGIKIYFSPGSPAGSSYNLLRNGTSVVTGYTSGTIYDPGSTTSYTYTVQAVVGTCTTNSTGSVFADANNTPGAPSITSITDVDACATSGIRVNFTGGSGAASHDLYQDGVLKVTGYTSGATYAPGDNISHTYVVRAINGSCTTDSTGVVGADGNSTPGAPAITAVTDIDPCVASGITVTYTGGMGASSHNLLKDGSVVVTGYTSGATYVPGDTSSHTYVVRAINGSCANDSSGAAGTDAASGYAATPVITSVSDVDACAASGIKVNYTTGDSLPFSDDLESLANWTILQISGTSGAWTTESGGANPTCTPESGLYMAMFNSYAATSGDETLLYQTTGMNIPGVYTSVTWTFYMYHDDTGTQNDTIQPQVSTDGTTWINVGPPIQRYSATPGWVLHTLDLTAYKGNTSMQIGFLGSAGGGYNMFLDAVSVTGTGGTVTYNLWVDGSAAVAGYASGDTYYPGDTNSHTYVIQAVAGSCTVSSSGVAGTDVNNVVGAPSITGITDVSTCDQSGIKIAYTAGSGAVSHNLLKDGTVVVTGYTSGSIYNPGDTAGHTYVVQAVHGTCTADSAGSAFADDNTGTPPGAPAITLITDETECAATGIHINYTPGTGAASHNLLKDGAVVVTGYASADLYIPGDTASHTYQVQAVNTGGCTTNSTGSPFSDMNKNLSPPLILGVSDVDDCASSGVKVLFSPGSGNVGGLTYNLVMDGTVVVTGYTSGATYIPGDNLMHSFVVRIVSGYCASDSFPQPGIDVDNHLATAAAITSITDNDACGLGIRVYYTAAPGAVTHNLLKDGVMAAMGYSSGATYNPGDTASHTYVVQGVKGVCTLNSAGSSFSDVNNTPGAPVITSIADNDPGIQDGIHIYYTGGSGATSHNLYQDGSLVASGYVSGGLYNPGDSASHYYVIRAIHAACHTDSSVVWATDAAGGGYPPPEAAPGDTSTDAQSWSSKTDISWPSVSGATGYTLYRGAQGDLSNLLIGGTNSCIKYQGSSTTATDTDSPASVPGHFYWYIVTASNASGEGPAGSATAGPRYLNASGFCP